jgi:hypothetical protein
VTADAARADTLRGRRDARVLALAWLALCLLALGLAVRDLSLPGLYYDEVIQSLPALEFLAADGRPHEMPGATHTRLFGRWWPTFTQPYMGALKDQLLIPSFALFGASPATLRLTTLAWSLLALYFAMRFAQQLFGLEAALLAGALLAVDPSFLFVSRHDWGSFSLALLLRCVGLVLLLAGWRRASLLRMLGGGLCFGLAVYNKIDFAAPLAASALALALAAPRELLHGLRTRARDFAAATAGFAIGAAPMLAGAGVALLVARSALATPSGAEVWREKIGALTSTLDGSYFDRLMLVGGRFDRMFDVEGAAASAFLVIYLLAVVFLLLQLVRGRAVPRAGTVFVLASALLSSLAILATPRAVRIHHVLGAYPFPQLVVALAVTQLANAWRGAAGRTVAAAIALVALGGSLYVTQRTWDTIERTHGRLWWSDALTGFARELAAEPGAVAVSLDWGFHAQLRFLDRGLELREPVWRLLWAEPGALPIALEGDERTRYLLWDRRDSVFPLGAAFLDAVQRLGPERIEIRRHLDREGSPAFVSIRIAAPHRIVYRGAGARRPIEVMLR